MQKTANDLKKDFSRQNKAGILGVQFSQAALALFVSVFLTARILTATNGNIAAVALFLAVQFTAIILMFALTSVIVKKFSRVWCIRASALFLLASIIIVLLLQDRLAQVYLLLAAVYGSAQGIYWASIHIFTSEAMGGKKMSGYIAWYIALITASNALFPFTLGAIIEFADFGVAVMIALGICVMLLAFTLILRDQRKSGNAGLSMRKFFRHLKQAGLGRPMWSQFWIQSLYVLQYISSICITILIVLKFDNNFSLGLFTSIFAAVSVLTLAVYKSIRSPRIKLWTYYITSFIPLLSALALLFAVSPAAIIICQAGFIGFKSAAQTELDKTRMNLMSDFGAEQFHTESLLLTEFAYFIARILVCSLIIAAFSLGAVFFQILVVALIATVPLSAVLLHYWTRKYIKKENRHEQ